MNIHDIDLELVRVHDLPGVQALIRIAEALEVIAERLPARGSNPAPFRWPHEGRQDERSA